MEKVKVFTVPFRRKRQGKTYYKKRIKILLSNKHRLVIRKSLRNVEASIVKYGEIGDKVILTVNSSTLAKFGWKGGNGNLSSAYLTGLLAGKKAIKSGIHDAILDLGLNKPTKGSRLYAALAGAIDSGLKIPFEPEVLPPKDRISGEHIAKYAKSLRSEKERYDRQFSDYIKKGMDPEDLVIHFNEIKGKLNG